METQIHSDRSLRPQPLRLLLIMAALLARIKSDRGQHSQFTVVLYYNLDRVNSQDILVLEVKTRDNLILVAKCNGGCCGWNQSSS